MYPPRTLQLTLYFKNIQKCFQVVQLRMEVQTPSEINNNSLIKTYANNKI